MKKLNVTARFFLASLAVVLLTGTKAQWSNNPTINTPISTTVQDQRVPNMVSDGNGGVIIAWIDNRSGNDMDIYAQRVDVNGVPQWTLNGIPVCTATDDQTSVKVVSDGTGGAILIWQDKRNGVDADIYAQRINAAGVVQWTTNGVAVCNAAGNQYLTKSFNKSAVSDNANGAIVTWQDDRNGNDDDIYAQRVNGSGTVLWTSNGLAVCTATNNQERPLLVSDNANGAIITWQDYRNGTDNDTYVQRVQASGAVQWSANGVAIGAFSGDQYEPVIAATGSGSAIVCWVDSRNGTDDDIYAQLVSPAGAPQWTLNGVAVCSASNYQAIPYIESDGSGGAIITWSDYRNTIDNDVYAQRISSSATPLWAANGLSICATSGDQNISVLAPDGNGGAVFTWNDGRNGFTNLDVYVQRVNGAGTTQWAANGLAAGSAPDHQDAPVIIPDGQGGAILAWSDYRSGNDIDVYVQNICAAGILGGAPPAPVNINGLTSICTGYSVTYSIAPVQGATSYTWSLPAGWSGTSASTSITTLPGITGGAVSVSAVNGCGNSPAAVVSVTVNPGPNINTTVSNGVVITAAQAGANYQWINCSSSTAIPNATNQTYTATTNGSYAVVITLNGCTLTSTCVTINSVGLAENTLQHKGFVAPNPGNGAFTLTNFTAGTYYVINSTGQIIQSFIIQDATPYTIHLEQYSKGIYFLTGSSANNTLPQKLIIE